MVSANHASSNRPLVAKVTSSQLSVVSLRVSPFSFFFQENLSSVANENWSAWQENEAAELITFLGLRRSGELKSQRIFALLSLVYVYAQIMFYLLGIRSSCSCTNIAL